MADVVKLTKKDKFELVLAVLKGEKELVDLTDFEMENCVELCESALVQLEKDKIRSKKRAAKKKAAGDPLKELVFSVLTDEFMDRVTLTQLVNEALGIDPESEDAKTPGMIQARLNVLVKEGMVEKGNTGGKERKVVYKRASVE